MLNALKGVLQYGIHGELPPEDGDRPVQQGLKINGTHLTMLLAAAIGTPFGAQFLNNQVNPPNDAVTEKLEWVAASIDDLRKDTKEIKGNVESVEGDIVSSIDSRMQECRRERAEQIQAVRSYVDEKFASRDYKIELAYGRAIKGDRYTLDRGATHEQEAEKRFDKIDDEINQIRVVDSNVSSKLDLVNERLREMRRLLHSHYQAETEQSSIFPQRSLGAGILEFSK